MQSELYLGAPGQPGDLARMRADQPDAVVFNGFVSQYAFQPLAARAGQRVRIWLLNAGPNRSTAFHIVGAQFDTVYAEGAYRLRGGDPGGAQVLDLAPASGDHPHPAGHLPVPDPRAGRRRPWRPRRGPRHAVADLVKEGPAMGTIEAPARPGDAEPRRPANRERLRPGKAGRRRRFIPPQHGAWAMLAVPYLAGLITAGYRWPDAPLLVAWIAGYLLSYYVFQAVKSRRVNRYRHQLVLYAAVAAPLAAVVVASRPRVLIYAPVYATLFAVNTWYAARRRERAFLNDLASVLQSCLMVFVVATVADAGPAAVLGVFVLCLAYFLGTVFYVKTIIRERGNPRYLRLSLGYHVLALAAAAWLGLWPAALFAWLLARAELFPRLGWTPKRTGIVEIVNCMLLLLVAGTTPR